MQENKKKRPNIVLILADDMGFSDIGCFGSEIKTPNLDKMAAKGIRFSQMYNSARCCPTRASLLTGLNPHQAGIGLMTSNLHVPEYQGYLRKDCVTVAEVLKKAGYHTGLSGKWHVGGSFEKTNQKNWVYGSEDHPTPLQRGFEKFIGTLDGCGSYFNPHTLVDNGQPVQIKPEDDFYYTDEISKNAINMIDEFSKDDNPFFLYVAYTAPHWPLHARPEDIEKYKGKYSVGWDEVRRNRYEKLVTEGIIKESWEMTQRDESAPAWEDAPDKEWEEMRMAVYAAQVDRMDQGIGQIMDKLKEENIEQDTLVIFLSDNGACEELLTEDGWVNNYVYPTTKGEEVVPGNDPTRMPGGEDTYMSYGLPWANASNAPFRLYKHWVHEGGIATPFILYWPEKIKDQNQIMNKPAQIIDITATCIDVAGAEYPRSYNGTEITPLEGISFLSLLEGEDWERGKPIILEHEGNCAVRIKNWKLVRKYPGDWELYDMEIDRTELHDVSLKHPELVETMKKEYEEWAKRCKVLDREAVIQMES